MAADYDNDGHADIAVFRDGTWYWLGSSDNVFAYAVMGQAGDVSLLGKYNVNVNFNLIHITLNASAYQAIFRLSYDKTGQNGKR